MFVCISAESAYEEMVGGGGEGDGSLEERASTHQISSAIARLGDKIKTH